MCKRISLARAQAKKIARDSGMTHQQALDAIARREGFGNWGSFRKAAVDVPNCQVLDYAALRKSANEFYGILVGSYRIIVCLSADGPYIVVRDLENRHDRGRGVALGHCTEIHFLEADDDRVKETGYWICKYDRNQARASLVRLSEDQAKFVADHFAIPLGYGRIDRNFYDTPAWDALLEYVQRHPRKSAKFGKLNSYVGDWYGNAVDGLKVRTSP